MKQTGIGGAGELSRDWIVTAEAGADPQKVEPLPAKARLFLRSQLNSGADSRALKLLIMD